MRMERVRWRDTTYALQTPWAMRVRDVCTPRNEHVSEKCACDTECVHNHPSHTQQLPLRGCDILKSEKKSSDFVVPLPSWFHPPRRCPPICFSPIIISECFSGSGGMRFCWLLVMPLCGIKIWDSVNREVPFPIMWEPYKPVELLWVQILAVIVSSFWFLSLTCFFVHANNSPCSLMVIWAPFYWVLFPLVSDRAENDTT